MCGLESRFHMVESEDEIDSALASDTSSDVELQLPQHEVESDGLPESVEAPGIAPEGQANYLIVEADGAPTPTSNHRDEEPYIGYFSV